MDGDVGDVEAARTVERDVERRRVWAVDDTEARSDPPHVDRVVLYVEGGPQAPQRAAVADVDRRVVAGLDVAHALGRDQPPELLDSDRGPPRDVDRHLLEREQRALAAAISDRVRHLGATVAAGGGDLVDRVVADQVADVGNHPAGAGLDELVVVELLDVVLNDPRLRRHDAEQRLQRAAGLRVLIAVDRRQEREQLVGVEAHDQTRSSPVWPGRAPASAPPPAASDPRRTASAGPWPAELPAVAERLELDRGHARDLLDQLDDLAGGDVLAELALIERERAGDRLPHPRQHLLRVVLRLLDRDGRGEREQHGYVGGDPQRDERLAVRLIASISAVTIGSSARPWSRLPRLRSGTRRGLAEPRPRRQRLGDAGERQGEVLVVLSETTRPIVSVGSGALARA